MNHSPPTRKRHWIVRTSIALLLGIVVFVPQHAVDAQPKPKKIGDVVVRGFLKASASKSHEIKLSASRFYQLAVKAMDATLPTELRVEDAKGKLLSQKSGAGSIALEFSPPSDAKYKLVVKSNAPAKGSAYELTVKIESLPGGTRRPPFTTQGMLARGGKTLPGNKFFREYRVAFRAGQTYIIQMFSNRFDTYLYLKNNQNRTLGANDDGPGIGLNSQITFRCPQTGIYNIYATSLVGNQVGQFTVKVK